MSTRFDAMVAKPPTFCLPACSTFPWYKKNENSGSREKSGSRAEFWFENQIGKDFVWNFYVR